MGLFSFLSPQKTQNTTQNTTQVSAVDTRVAASDYGTAVGQDGILDQSIYFSDSSQEDNSIYFSDKSDHSTVVNDSRDLSTVINDSRTFNSLDADVAQASIFAGRDLGQSAFELVNSGLRAQADTAEQSRLFAQNSLANLTDSQNQNLRQTLELVSGFTGGAVKLAERGQDESAAARASASETIKEVLGFKEAGDTKVAQDLIKWGGIAVAVFALAFLFRPKRS